jgi:hypothetical protein
LRLIQARAPQKGSRLRGQIILCCALLLVAGCANEGIWPTEPLPAAPPGPPPPTPSFHAPNARIGDQDEVLTNIEREELETRLAKLAKDRQRGVERRIQMSK